MASGGRTARAKLHRLEYKKSIADAAVDGVVPEGNLRTPVQAQQDVMDWLSRLETGQMSEVARAVIKIPLDGTPADVERRVQRYGDFSKMNNRWYASDSNKTHDRLANEPRRVGALPHAVSPAPRDVARRALQGGDPLAV
jgi:hypothetical protein